MIKIIADAEERIDKLITRHTNFSRNQIQSLIKNHQVFLDPKINIRKSSFFVKTGQVIFINPVYKQEIKIRSQKIDFKIVFENEDFLIVDKPNNLVVHPGPGNFENTLVNGLIYHFKNNLSDINGFFRPGIVHRLDKQTSGLMIVAKNNEAHNFFAKAIQEKKVKRIYVAVVCGFLNSKITNIDLPLSRDSSDFRKQKVTYFFSKQAKTKVILLKNFYLSEKPMSLVECVLETGRTHQIRVHLSYINHPIYGDPVYGQKIDELGQRLHSYKLAFEYKDGKKYQFESEIPNYFFVGSKN